MIVEGPSDMGEDDEVRILFEENVFVVASDDFVIVGSHAPWTG
jgi:hypothetical protein